MSAVAGPVESDREVKQFIRHELETWCGSTEKHERNYTLTFRIADRTFKVPIQIKKLGAEGSEASTFVILLGTSKSVLASCVLMTLKCGFELVESKIMKDDKDMRCFDPILSERTLPPDVKQLDILTTLRTKLNLIFTPEGTKLSDALKINPEHGVPYLSVWRLLRGELTPYEKYGYRSINTDDDQNVFDYVRTQAQTKTFQSFLDLLHRHEETRSLGEEFVRFMTTNYPDSFKPENFNKPLAEIMKTVPYNSTNKLFKGELWVDFLFGFLLPYSYDEIAELSLNPSSERWRSWDQQLSFISLMPIAGGGRRQSRRKRLKARRAFSRRR